MQDTIHMIIGYLDPEGMICFGGIRGGGGLSFSCCQLGQASFEGRPPATRCFSAASMLSLRRFVQTVRELKQTPTSFRVGVSVPQAQRSAQGSQSI